MAEMTPLTYGSICSGIEAASVAWHPLGWEPRFFAEIDKFPSAVVAHQWPEVPNLGDFTKIGTQHGTIDVLVGGTPCQAFSVAGLRKGLDDPRGNLTLAFLALIERIRPRWVVWENVPGVLSIDAGRVFGAFLGGLGQLGYGFAYRVLDAQFFGVPQRRRRVFVVGHFGDWRRAAAVLFERHSLSGHPAPSRKAGKGIASSFTPSSHGSYAEGIGTLRSNGGDLGGGSETLQVWQAEVAPALDTTLKKYMGYDNQHINGGAGWFVPGPTHALRADGFDASEDGTGRGTPLVPTVAPCLTQNYGKQPDNSNAGPMLIPILEAGARTGKSTDDIRAGIGIGEAGDPMFTLQSGKQHAIAFNARQDPDSGEVTHPIDTDGHSIGIAFNIHLANSCAMRGDGRAQAALETETARSIDRAGFTVQQGGTTILGPQMAVRRLTPRECERLQGFPDDYTLIPWRGKMAPDGPRYKALGNSMAVPVMRWIGERIQTVEDLDVTNEKGQR